MLRESLRERASRPNRSEAEVQLSVARVEDPDGRPRLQTGDRLTRRWAGVRRVTGTRRFRFAAGVVSSLLAAALLAVAIQHFATTGWPLADGNPLVIVSAGLLFLLAYGFKAYGWRRLFRAGERPSALSLAAAGGGASLMGVALPGRFDEAARIVIVRRYPGCPAGVPAMPFALHARADRQHRARPARGVRSQFPRPVA
jgi:hypothetical protein